MSNQILDTSISILVVDELSTMRRVVKNCLKQLGFENVAEAENKESALSLLNNSNFRLIISDCHLPNMLGLELQRMLKADKRWKQIPFLLVTAEPQRKKILDAAKDETPHVIVKPFTAEVLKTKMAELFQ